ncbi:MBL fold metallo-hydrolase [Persicobacter diffluens]|uniref:Membrane protein n=1 Tax=Persicobacter diffluens TaxID=981 RepID=A0AAN4W149_9BACT|nr:membrane protein [Persicobacter diffluens]
MEQKQAAFTTGHGRGRFIPKFYFNMKVIIKRIFLSALALVLVVLISGTAFMNFSPQFGGMISEAEKALYRNSGHYKDGIFLNEEEIVMELNCHSLQQMIRETFRPDPAVVPDHNIEVEKVSPETIGSLPDSLTQIIWLGHSSFIIETAGMVILLDPVFGQYASPHPMLGRKRFNAEMPVTIEQLPKIDAVIISHDHYDHLDYESIMELKAKTDHFFVPLGVGSHLKRWEIPAEKITEMDWWQEQPFKNLNIIFTPSRHMSGRGLTDQSATLWGSWIINNPYAKLYFSGDGGYGRHFKAIGEKYGPFDVALMECGQYNELWRDVHMMPEETVQASIEVGAKFIIPIHWGSFALATHSWTDPVERVTTAAELVNLPLATPRIGEVIILPQMSGPTHEHWWTESEATL